MFQRSIPDARNEVHNVDTLAPFLTELFNRTLSAGAVPTAFKAAYVTQLLKKSDLELVNVSY